MDFDLKGSPQWTRRTFLGTCLSPLGYVAYRVAAHNQWIIVTHGRRDFDPGTEPTLPPKDRRFGMLIVGDNRKTNALPSKFEAQIADNVIRRLFELVDEVTDELLLKRLDETTDDAAGERDLDFDGVAVDLQIPEGANNRRTIPLIRETQRHGRLPRKLEIGTATRGHQSPNKDDEVTRRALNGQIHRRI